MKGASGKPEGGTGSSSNKNESQERLETVNLTSGDAAGLEVSLSSATSIAGLAAYAAPLAEVSGLGPMEEGASKVSGTNPLPAQGQETPLTETPRPDVADTNVTSTTRQEPTQLIENIGAEQTSAGISAPSPDPSAVSQNAVQMQAKPDAPIAETQAQSTSQEDSEGQDEAPKLPWSPDEAMESSLAEDSAEGTTVFELPLLDAYGDPITYALTDGDGNPLTDTAFEVRDNTIVLGTGPELDFETAPEQVIHITATTEGGTSGPWPITLTVTDLAEDLTLGDAGVEFTDTGVAETSISGGTGDDTITGHVDGATIVGGAGNDLVTGGASDDDLTGDTGADTLIGNGGADTLYGGSGTDLLDGGAGDDRITAGTGWDTVYGGDGADTISGGSGGDELYGGSGDDLFTAGPGDDTLDGGEGIDVAVFSGAWVDYTITETDGVFTVIDNRPGSPDGTDRLINIELFRFADGDVTPADALNDGPVLTATGGHITENVAGAAIGTVDASDPDVGDSLTILVDDPRFEVADGILRLRDGESLDYEEDASLDLTITVTDSHGATDSQTVTVTVGNVNEHAASPVSDTDGVANAVQENAPIGTTVGITAMASDDDTPDTVTYHLSDDAGGRFAIDPETGVVTVAAPLDHETADSHSIEVTATSSDGSTSSHVFTIAVTDQNEAPVITSDGGGDSAHFTIDENTCAVTTLTADTEAGETLSYAIAGGADAALFTIDPVTGVLTFISPPDHETPTDADGDNTYEVRVEASDGTLADSQTVTVTIADVNEGPSVTAENGTVAENTAGAVVGAVTASDPDADDTLTYTTDDARFEVVGGELRLRDGVWLDHESDETVDVTVTATDATGLSDSQTVTVTVADVNEGPNLTAEDGTIAENVAGAVIGTVTASDPDTGDTLTYTTDDTRFEVVDGELRLRDGVSLDHESEETVDVTVTVIDAAGLSDSQIVTVTVADVNEGPSVTAEDGTIAENAAGAVIGTVTASDPDAGDTLTYTTDDTRFEVVDGELRLRDGESLDYETDGQAISLTVTATDSRGASDSQTVTINIDDQAEPITLTDEGVDFTDTGVAETSITGGDGNDTIVAHDDGGNIDGGGGYDSLTGGGADDTITGGSGFDTIHSGGGNDVLSGDAGRDSLSGGFGDDTLDGGDWDDTLDGGADDDLLDGGAGSDTIDGGSGMDIAIFSGSRADYTISEADGVYTVVDIHPDSPDGTDTITNVEVFRFADGDVDPADALNDAPTLTAEDGTIAENVAGAVIGTVSGYDPDAGDTLTYTTDDARFKVVDGELRLRDGVSLDHESEGTVDVTVTVTDAAGLSDSQTVTVTVADVNEGPIVTTEDGTVAENAAGAVVGAVTGYDPDAGDSLTYTTDDARFEIVEGELRLRDGVSLDHESEETVDVTVTATDAAGLSDSQIVTVTVADVNEGPEVSVAEAGFTARYFDVSHDINQLADIDWSATPTAYENISEINFANSQNSFWTDGGTDTFGAQITGNFLVETGGDYTFYLSADDGAVLYVDGQQWIDNDGQHSFRTETETITLDPGAHTIEVRYFENYGSAGLQLEWDGPDTDGRAFLQASTEVLIAENSAGVALGTVSASDPDDGDVVTYSVDDSRFEVVDGAVQVRDGASFDFESGETQVSLTITATDSQGATDSHVMTMTVRDTGEDIVLDDGGAGFTDQGVAENSITGGSGADTITGHDDGAVIDGAEEDDRIAGGVSDDSLSGGFGDDSIAGGAGDDTLSGDGVQNFVVNGSFEDTDGAAHSNMLARMGTIDGWTDANGTVFEMHEDGYSGQYATDGNHWLDMSESGAQMDISQTISGLGAGEAYRLSFDAGNYGSDLPGVMEVYFGGELIATIDPGTQDAMNSYAFDIEGGGGDGSNTLRFVEVGTNLNVGTSLDNVQIVAVDTGGNDTLDGGDGTDHAIWDGDVEDFGVIYDSATGTFTITDLNSEDGNEGVDTVTNVEVFDFNGTTYSHDEMVRIAELQANAAPTDMKFAANRDLQGADGSQVETIVTGTIQTNSENRTTIDRWQIDHAGGDLTIDVLADGVPAGGLDSDMVLLRLNGDGSYTVVASNDDGAPGNDGSANGTDSYIAESGLAAGTYFLAIGAYPVTEGEASDTTSTYSDSQNTGGDYQITFIGNSSIAVADNPDMGGTWGDPAGVATVVSESALEGTLGMGSVVTRVDGVSDADDTTHSFSLSDDAGGLFAIDSNTGEISLTDDPRDGSASQHTVTVVATDDTGESHSEEIGLTFGTEGDNTLTGTAGNDVIYGFDGTNLITGGAGDDTIVGGAAELSGPEWRSVYDNNSFHGTTGTDHYTVTANTDDYAVIRLNDSPNAVLGDGVADYVNIETTNNNVTLVISDFDFGTDSIILQEAYSNVSVNAQSDYTDFRLTYANGNQQNFRIHGLDGNNYPSQIFTTTMPDFELSVGDTVQFSGNASDFDISYDTATATFTITDLNTQDGLDEGTDLVSGVERFSFNGVEYDATDFMGASSVAADAFDYDTGFATAHPNATHNGNTSSETATTGHSDQVIYTRAGDDIVTSGVGNDVIYAGSGADTVTAGAGDDTIFGGTGNDLMSGGDGNDLFMVTAMQGADTINGGAGWIDTLELAGFTGDITIDGHMVDGDGWTLLLDAGYEVTGQTLDSLDLSADATGVITFDEGGTIDFTGIEKITF